MALKNQPKVIYLKDYQPSPFLIETAFLHFDLHPEETIVTVELLARGASTEVVLTHDLGATGAKVRGDYQQGWTGCLEKLAEAVQN